ncbi:MAG: FIST signal transduction protein [Saprospiraceae bacterium]
MNTKSFYANSIEQVDEILSEFKSSNFHPTLAIVFSSIKFDFKALSSVFDEHQIDLLACSSSGEICDREVVEEKISVMVMDMNRGYYRLCTKETGEMTTYQIAHEIGVHTKEAFDDPALILFSGGFRVDAQQIILGVKDGVQKQIPIYGGLSSDDLRMQETIVFSNQWQSNNGIVSLIIDTQKIEVAGMATSGWESIGTVNTITKAEGNLLYEINDQPALDFFIKYFGFYGREQDPKSVTLETLSGQYPLQVMRPGGYSVLRSPLIADEKNGSLILAGGVKRGDQFQFSIAPSFEVMEETVNLFGQFYKTHSEMDAIILVSCKARHTAFGPMIESEVEGIYDYWNKPLIGFFSYGEIGNVEKGDCEFHNATVTFIGLKEV